MNLVITPFSLVAAQSWWIGGLICLLGILRWGARGRIPQQIFFVGWIVVALALLFPVPIPAGWMSQVIPRLPAFSLHETTGGLAPAASSGISGLWYLVNSVGTLPGPAQSDSHSWNVLLGFAVVWLVGVVILTTIRLTLSYQFHRELRHSAARANPRYESMVLECAEQLRIKARITIFVSDAATGPAIGGVWRPYLLIPQSLGERLSDDELRLVILHELGHWRRRDNAVNLLIQCALIVHWFNPAAWLFAKMARSDCELACDEFVLGRTTAADPLAYGATLLKVLAAAQPRTTSPVLLGILGTKQQLTRRFEMIARFKTVSATRLLAGWALIGVVAVIAATGKLNASATGTAQPDASAAHNQTAPTGMKHYESAEWKFSLDIPKSWNAFPPVPSNSPYEVMRFASNEGGKYNLLIVFRNPHDVSQSLEAWSANVQETLAQGGFGNFTTEKKTLGTNATATLDFDKVVAEGKVWSCRHYFIADGSLGYVLGFGSDGNRSEQSAMYDSMVKSFRITQ